MRQRSSEIKTWRRTPAGLDGVAASPLMEPMHPRRVEKNALDQTRGLTIVREWCEERASKTSP
jgi:hypothetical protein